MGDACRFDFVYTRVTSVILNDVCFQHDIGLSLKLECEKLASEKTEMQRHYVMVSAGTNTLARFSLMPATENGFHDFDLDVFLFFQYYEMSYGLNIEMHKQVGLNFLQICSYANR